MLTLGTPASGGLEISWVLGKVKNLEPTPGSRRVRLPAIWLPDFFQLDDKLEI